MKTLILGLVFTLKILCLAGQGYTIILVNGEPNLVILDNDHNILETIQAVPYYFSSSLTHEQIIVDLTEQKSSDSHEFFADNKPIPIAKEEIDILGNAEFIKFIPNKALLDRIAVNRIREIARDYVDGGIEKLSLEIVYSDNEISKLLTDNRLSSVRDLLVAFGVEKSAIHTNKKLRNDLDKNPFVRIEYKKDLR